VNRNKNWHVLVLEIIKISGRHAEDILGEATEIQKQGKTKTIVQALKIILKGSKC
jgi:hypothetical protein